MNNKCKILVLSDVDKSTKEILKKGVDLAKVIDAEIDFFCVKKPTDVVAKESQLSAMRSINKKFIETDNQIKKMIDDVSIKNNIKISHKISFGNLKDEISNQLKETKPDIVLLGKRKPKVFSFLGDNIIDFLLKEFSGTILIVSEENLLEVNEEISIGLLNNVNLSSNKFMETLVSYSKKPLKSFQIDVKSAEEKVLIPKDTIKYVFEDGDNAIKNMSSYLTKNNINLLFLNREKNTNSKVANWVRSINCSLMLS
ncbi:universal stress protein [Polaribacter batillariae]|uniref:Universal stress protein n=1 Tax=Polaribacter batillariae TaxID=2808900 RepID=A0ABX7SRL8_9FLAO|nr:universal stress protein [Polaribacter batillariae]QTD36186.1 universal stress protein [Polaribacter batillariae]